MNLWFIGAFGGQFRTKSHLPVEGLIRATVFDHFCSGTNANESLKVGQYARQAKSLSVLDYSVEGGAKEEIS